MFPGHSLKPLPKVSEGCAKPGSIVICSWAILNKTAITQFQSDTFGGKRGI